MRFLRDKRGATMAEYAVIAAVLILLAIVIFGNLGAQIVSSVGSLIAGMQN